MKPPCAGHHVDAKPPGEMGRTERAAGFHWHLTPGCLIAPGEFCSSPPKRKAARRLSE
ncbi:hypothetical protein GTCCBUS3UF5_35860 [Geobacillus thermoleovorans CCB_US3_UF5]|uniref:Uncharacterized protein n=2 Tax=Geobacillus TaxID=129337 RepID=A0A1Q5SYQ2_9BACL|nr:hypothetical protein GTCCBUS3UF5_35860 [Geobacillus thermoleovorans CCB_US3_UF5]OKO93103.1 hypothetical protein BRO54_2053 [Geobacillus proteiniphilus]GAJ57368.1 hypothetical protein B23_0557 [Geobacillus thermoleovorans B23]